MIAIAAVGGYKIFKYMERTLSDKEIIEDYKRFLRHEAMRANTMQDYVAMLVLNEINK